MYSTTYFDEYQKQFGDWQKQFGDWQKKFFDTWLANLPTSNAELNVSDSFEKALNLQEELVNSYLEAQEKSSQMMLASQRKLWQDYFQQLRRQTEVKSPG
uniref:Thylakoid-associated protein n=1 Tax=Cyanothece sp. (strain PCC 7425 / ATCC 29141) TaxID=395961 RepID=B8HP37_CYAP4